MMQRAAHCAMFVVCAVFAAGSQHQADAEAYLQGLAQSETLSGPQGHEDVEAYLQQLAESGTVSPGLLGAAVAKIVNLVTDFEVAGEFVTEPTLRRELQRREDKTGVVRNSSVLCNKTGCAPHYESVKFALESRLVFANCTIITGFRPGPIQEGDVLVFQTLLREYPRLVERSYVDVAVHGEQTSADGVRRFRSLWSTRKESLSIGSYEFYVEFNPAEDLLNATYVKRGMSGEWLVELLGGAYPKENQEAVDYTMALLAAHAEGGRLPASPWSMCNVPLPFLPLYSDPAVDPTLSEHMRAPRLEHRRSSLLKNV